MDVNEEHGTASGRDRVLERGAEALGWHVGAQPRNVRGCDQGERLRILRLRLRARREARDRRDVARRRGVSRRARARRRDRAHRVLVERGARRRRRRAGAGACAGGRRRVRRLSHTCVAPAFWPGERSIGRNLRLPPGHAARGRVRRADRPWDGDAPGALLGGARASRRRVRRALRDCARSIPASSVRGFSGTARARASTSRKRYPCLAPIFPLVRDRDGGRGRGRVTTASRRPRIGSRSYDLRHLRAGFVGAARILEAAGAQAGSVDARASGRLGAARTWCRAASSPKPMRAAGSRTACSTPPRTSWAPRGWAGRRRSPRATRRARPGRSRGSSCATGRRSRPRPGVNPMITIAAVAHMNASALASRLA